MDDETFQRSLRARPPADPVYRARLSADPATSVGRPATRPTSRLVPALAMLLALVLLAGVVVLVGSQLLRSSPLPPGPAGFFGPAGDMNGGHGMGFTATVLADGRVLVVGGETNGAVTSRGVEIWDPATKAFAATGPMSKGRSGHTATLLRDGRVLILGGWDTGDSSAEVWEPRTGMFGPPILLPDDRRFSAVTSLHDGRVLIVGGGSQDAGDQPPAELWDPTTGVFTPIGPPALPRIGQTATTLPDGRVLVIGGDIRTSNRGRDVGTTDAQLWDPIAGTFAPTGSLAHARSGHSAMLLPDGHVLVVGGETDSAGRPVPAEVWDPGSGAFSELRRPVPDGTLASLTDGRLLVIPAPLSSRCATGQIITTATQIWDPLTGAMTPAGSFSVPRTDPVMTTLPDGRVLVLGGQPPREPQPSVTGPGCPGYIGSVTAAEVWSPTTPSGMSPGPS